MQVHCRHISDWNTAVHSTFLPVEVLGHEADDVFAESNSCLFGKVRRHLKLVHADWLTFDPRQILKIDEQNSNLTVNRFNWKLSFFD